MGRVVKCFLFFQVVQEGEKAVVKKQYRRGATTEGLSQRSLFLADKAPHTCLSKVRAWQQHFRRRCHNFESQRAGERGRDSNGPFHNLVMQF